MANVSPNTNYIPLALVGAHVGSAKLCVESTRLRVGFLDINMLVSAHVGGLDQHEATTRRGLHCGEITQIMRFLVEYSLKSFGLTVP